MKAAAMRSVPHVSKPARSLDDPPPWALALMADMSRLEGKLDTLTLLVTRQRASLSRDDYRVLARLLPVIGAVLGSEMFAARDLANSEDPSVRLVVQGYSPKRLGKLFTRASGHPLAGYVVEQAGEELNVALWRVLRMEVS